MDGTFDLSEYLSDYLTEANEHMTALDDGLLEAERRATAGQALPDELVNSLFRSMHTIKGMAGMMEFTGSTRLAHHMEQALDEVRNGHRQLSGPEIGVLISGLDALKRLLGQIEATGAETGIDLSAALASVEKLTAAPAAPVAAPVDGEDWLARLDPHDQMAALVEVAKGTSLYQISAVAENTCAEVGVPAWLEGLGLIGTVLGAWRPDGTPLGGDLEGLLGPLHVLLLSEAEFESVLDCTGVPAEALKHAPLPWEQPGAVAAAAAIDGPETESTASVPAASGLEAITHHEPPASGERRDPARSAERAASIRIEASRLDDLMEIVGELMIQQTRLKQLSAELAQASAEDEGDAAERLSRVSGLVAALDETTESMGRLNGGLQDSAMRLRMQPVGSLFNRYPRVVRDLARDCDKLARLEIFGAETELDKTVIEQLGDPLVHLMRNAIDHGLESPEFRRAAGKPAEGVVTLSAAHEGSHVVIEVADDGGGINQDRVLKKALERGLVSADELLTDAEIFQLIFHPGFSTAEAITNLSGRGVGMDVVQQNILKLGGTIQVLSTPGVGTRFVIRLPLTLLVAKALLIQEGPHTFAIPLSSVEETLRLRPELVKTVAEREVLQLRGDVVPLVKLDAALALPAIERDGRPFSVVVVRQGERRMGLVVEDFIGQQDVVVKPLGHYMGQVPGVAGATILGTGRVALILDLATLHDPR